MELVTWRGTPGVGDFMWALNSVHNYCYRTNKKVNLEMHWEHEKDYLHHFEDPETIIERMEYIHNFYHRKEDVTVTHVFAKKTRYSDWKYNDDVVTTEEGRLRVTTRGLNKPKNRFWFESGMYTDTIGGQTPNPNWIFRKDAFRQKDAKKIVIWTPALNAELPRTWKRFLTNENWDDIIKAMRQAGLQVVELSYRTPIREVIYHISNARLVVCYDGMWHYIARNFCTPMVIVSPEKITKYHTPHGITASPFEDNAKSIFWWIDNLSDMLGHSKRKAKSFENKMRNFYG